MSLGVPLWLLALALVPLALLAQWRSRGRARRFALRYPAVGSLLAAAGEVGAGRRRHLPLALALLAIALLAVALARPSMSRRVSVGSTAFMLVLDHSGSMASDDVSPTRIQAAIAAGNTFIDQLPADARVGLVGFGTSPDAEQPPTTDHAVTRQLLDAQQANGGTDTGPALALALHLLDGSDAHHVPSAIVLLSDGAANLGESPVSVAETAKAEHIPIYTVALGTPDGVLTGPFGETVPVPPDPQLMAQIAQSSGGRAFDAQSAGRLSSIYRTLGSRLSTVTRRHDITVWWLLAAGLALLGAVGLALRRPAAVIV